MVRRRRLVGEGWWRAAGLPLLLLLLLLLGPADAASACADLLPPERPAPTAERPIEAEDLVRLRDIGVPDASVSGASPLAVSPDGREVAFVISRADLATNGYCRALVIVPLAPPSKPRIADTGGELITLRAFVRDLQADYGFPQGVTPVWSPDGTRIAYLKREKGSTQAWIARSDGSGAARATSSPADVESVAWAAGGRSLVYTSRLRAVEAARRIDEEGRSGWLYDERVATNSGPRPKLRSGDAPLERFSIDLAAGNVRAAAVGPPGLGTDPSAVSSRSGRRAWTAPESRSLVSDDRLWATNGSGEAVSCGSRSCRGSFLGFWWDGEGREITFLRREGWNNGIYAFYRWTPGEAEPVRTHAGEDVIQNCVPAGERLVCTLEDSVTPRRIVLVDPRTGASKLLFDPNPEFAGIRAGKVRRLRWRNDRGLEAWGDLMLPAGYRGGKLPMVVVQYHSRGFLRGGTGDEYPIPLFAARGFAVLSFERPQAVASALPDLTTVEAVNAANQVGWAERRSLLSSLEKGVEAAVRTGAVDLDRIGITGLSDGATSARFALINSSLFKAASISSCCIEPRTAMTYGGIAFAEFNRKIGLPPASADHRSFWEPMSFALNAERISTPLLMQLADEEYLLALEAYGALREKGQPVELYVFPDEHHIKTQPIHRSAIYRRNIDWFDFWLRCRKDPHPSKAAQYARWEKMREKAAEAPRCK